jgi:NAD(P)H-hydrate repair Nnr-like enzyme with NAD(P)H-hydrate dehydratase domain
MRDLVVASRGRARLRVVLDADALTSFAGDAASLTAGPSSRRSTAITILTPHRGGIRPGVSFNFKLNRFTPAPVKA